MQDEITIVKILKNESIKDGLVMQLTENLIKKLPFPYFFIDHHFRILSSSIQMDTFFPDQLFTQLLDKQEINQFITTFSMHNMLEIKISIRDCLSLHRIYKIQDAHNCFHLFCFPVEDKGETIGKALQESEQKLFQTNELLIENNQDIQKTAQEIHESTVYSEYYATVSTLAAGIAHEIRNPLTTVKGFIQLLKPYLSEIGKEQYADIALDEINRANDLIFEFLNATKPQESKKSEISLNKIIKEIAMLYESEALLRNIELNIQLSIANPRVIANGKQMKQVLMNVIKNAIEAIAIHTDDKYGQIQISVEFDKQLGVIIVKDNGCGMNEETLEKLFLPFYTTKQTGTGIGLSICKKIIEEHEGQMKISSSPGKGTITKIILPRIQEMSL